MPLFRTPEAQAWRPAPWWQSVLDALVLAALPLLLVGPACLGLGGTMRMVGWFGFALLLGLYGWVFNRLRPANPPAEAIVPWRVALYLGAVVVALAAQVAAGLVDAPWIIVVTTAAVVAGVAGVSQWFERGIEGQVRGRGLDRSPRRQSVNVLREARNKARGREDVSTVIGEERATERWARERRERTDPTAARTAVTVAAGGADLPDEEQEVRRVYRPADRLPSENPNKRRKRRKR